METQEIDQPKPFPFPVKRVHPDYLSMTERYFEPKFVIPKQSQMEAEQPVADQCIMYHHNGLPLITLSPYHPILKEHKEVDRIEFVQQSIENAVVGKKKKGGQTLKPNTIICRVHCKDESVYSVVAGIKANLLEVNKKLIDNPQWLVTDPWSKGYIAILQQQHGYAQEESQKLLLDFDQYTERLANAGADDADGDEANGEDATGDDAGDAAVKDNAKENDS